LQTPAPNSRDEQGERRIFALEAHIATLKEAAMTSMSPQLEVLRVKPVELRAPNFRLSEGLIDLRQGSNRCVHDRRNTFRERGHASGG
jgi:hypothetical protein